MGMSEGCQGETSPVGPFHDDPAASLGHGSVHDVIDPESGGYTDADVAPRFPVACLAAVLLGKLGLLYRLLVVGSPLVVTENDAATDTASEASMHSRRYNTSII